MNMCLFIPMEKFSKMGKILFVFLIVGFNSGLLAQNLDNIVLKDAGSGDQFEMRSLKAAKAATIIFFSNTCAYNDYYIDRIKNLAAEFESSGIRFVLINSNKNETQSENYELEMKKFLQENQLLLPYLADPNQVLKRSLGASRSPEAYLITFSGKELTKVYSGAIDDSPQSEGDVNHPYLQAAILTLLQGNMPEVNYIRPAGCLIR